MSVQTITKTCPDCLSEVDPRARRCAHCGAKLSTRERFFDKAQRISWNITGSIFVLIICVLLLLFLLNS